MRNALTGHSNAVEAGRRTLSSHGLENQGVSSIPVCTGSGSGMQNPLANFNFFSLVRDDRGLQVNPLCHHDITHSDRQIGNASYFVFPFID